MSPTFASPVVSRWFQKKVIFSSSGRAVNAMRWRNHFWSPGVVVRSKIARPVAGTGVVSAVEVRFERGNCRSPS